MRQNAEDSDLGSTNTENPTQKVQQNSIKLINNHTRHSNNLLLSTSQCSQLIKGHQYEKAIIQLNKALISYETQNEASKGSSPYWKLCTLGNLAMCYQRLWQIEKSHKYCIKIVKQLQSFISAEKKKGIKLNLMKQLIRINFQHCAILSQINQHNQALQLCKTTFQLLSQFLKQILQFVESLETKPIKKSAQNIFFIEQVGSFAQQMLKMMLHSLQQPVSPHLQYNSQFYFWARNPSKNQQQITRMLCTKKINQQYKRSILGVNKNKINVSQFNIGSIMHIQQYYIKQFEKAPPLQQYLFKDKIYQLMINCSLAFFTIATELRFIETANNLLNSHQSLINRKYGYQQKSDAYKLSQVYHIKSIDLIAKNIPFSIPYLTHIIRSYEKHYILNKPLPIIQSIADQSLISGITFKAQKSTNDVHYKEKQRQQEEQESQYQFHKIQAKKYRSISKARNNVVNCCLGSKEEKGRMVYEEKKFVCESNYQIEVVKNVNGVRKRKSSSLGKISGKNRKIVKKGEINMHKKSNSQMKLVTTPDHPSKSKKQAQKPKKGVKGE